MRTRKVFKVTHLKSFKNSLLNWGNEHDEAVWLDSNQHRGNYSSFDAVLAVDGLTAITTDHTNAFDDLKEYQSQTRDWIFGYLSYDLKNDTEDLKSQNRDGLKFPDLYFFQPKKIIKLIGNQAEFLYLNMVSEEIQTDYDHIVNNETITNSPMATGDIHIKMRIFKDEYFKKVAKMLEHIYQGNIYEANFCQEFYAADVILDALNVYKELNKISKSPFATYVKLFDKYIISASPERYLKKIGYKIISQPIKGTAPRALDKVEDEHLKNNLQKDEKERAENIMIVDLVRNDLSKTAQKGSVAVDELCKAYSFEQVHQMISTVTSHMKEGTHPVDVIKESFPMGSMTGAPKIAAMNIIEALESFKRGVYSGAVGYFTPDSDFDFNVVIRTVLYNETERYLSYSVGSAITAKSIPIKEYEECLVKAKAMRSVLEKKY
ncbi:anthranilate synthase component I family protein [Maribacter sp. 2210JD10-5]|uniref:anthranilate synthase component I family protein n=1 Tax=Maribacter sp. 2210JD10-5 TaxID=3386272 RepID=UPI0039BC6F2B